MRKSPMQRRTAMRAQSKANRAFGDQLDDMRPLVMARCHGICEICHYEQAVLLHHKLRRSQGGTNELGNLLGLCAMCHDHVHGSPRWAYDHGYMTRRNQ